MSHLPPAAYRVFAEVAAGAISGRPTLTDQHVIAAVSGGLDSMVLFRFLVWLQARVPFHLTVAHLNHGLRPEADEEAKLVESYAASFGVHVQTHVEDVAARAAKEGEGLEAAGRRARYEFFDRVATSGERPALIALAHHQDDQAETVLLHLTRGSGLKGLAGMLVLDENRWRPFLYQKRTTLEMVAASLDIPYATDLSNVEPEFLRNRLRHELLPLWNAIAGHDMNEKLSSFASFAAADDAALDRLTLEIKSRVMTGPHQVSLASLREYPDAVIRRVLDRVYEARTGGRRLARRHIDLLLKAIRQDKDMGRIDLPEGVSAQISYGQLSFVTE